jgi:hypothetical protein
MFEDGSTINNGSPHISKRRAKYSMYGSIVFFGHYNSSSTVGIGFGSACAKLRAYGEARGQGTGEK